MGTPSERRGLGRLGGLSERSLLTRLLRGLPGVDVRVVADPGLRRARPGEDQVSSEGLTGPGNEALNTGASSPAS
jgi:hypothetical protein